MPHKRHGRVSFSTKGSLRRTATGSAGDRKTRDDSGTRRERGARRVSESRRSVRPRGDGEIGRLTPLNPTSVGPTTQVASGTTETRLLRYLGGSEGRCVPGSTVVGWSSPRPTQVGPVRTRLGSSVYPRPQPECRCWGHLRFLCDTRVFIEEVFSGRLWRPGPSIVVLSVSPSSVV